MTKVNVDIFFAISTRVGMAQLYLYLNFTDTSQKKIKKVFFQKLHPVDITFTFGVLKINNLQTEFELNIES